MSFISEACQEFFSPGKYFHQGQNRARAARKKIMYNRQEGGGAEYFVMTKKKLVLASDPMPPIRVFFQQG